jgi:hypothetical protein
MARRYEIDELLWLRSSPLVAKPPGLPPIEEWMYASSACPPAGIPHAYRKTDTDILSLLQASTRPNYPAQTTNYS